MYEFLNGLADDHEAAVVRFFQEYRGELAYAFRSLDDVSRLVGHDEPWPESGELDELHLCDACLHPAYLKLCEAVLGVLILPVALAERCKRRKSTQDIKLFQRVEEAHRAGFGDLMAPFNRVIRNAIAHGSVTYRTQEIRYQDKDKSEVRCPREMARLFDDLLDICHGLALGYRVFWITHKAWMNRHQLLVPLPVLSDELRAQLETPGWSVGACLEAGTTLAASQINIFIKCGYMDSVKARYFALRTAVLGERIAPGYARYFLRIESKNRLPGWAGFDGRKLAAIRDSQNACEADYVSALDSSGIVIWGCRRLPVLLARLGTLKETWESAGKLVLEEALRSAQPIAVRVRHARSHRQSLHTVVRVWVVLFPDEGQDVVKLVRSNTRWIVRRAVKGARRLSSSPLLRWLPNGYVEVSLFTVDFRTRRLYGFGLGEEFLCLLTRKRFGAVETVGLLGGITEMVEGVRIDWNSHSPFVRGTLVGA